MYGARLSVLYMPSGLVNEIFHGNGFSNKPMVSVEHIVLENTFVTEILLCYKK